VYYNVFQLTLKKRSFQKQGSSRRRRRRRPKLDVNLTKKEVKCYIWSIALCGVETWTLRKVNQKCLESFEIWCSRRMEKISWKGRVRNEEVLLRDEG